MKLVILGALLSCNIVKKKKGGGDNATPPKKKKKCPLFQQSRRFETLKSTSNGLISYITTLSVSGQMTVKIGVDR